MRRPSVFGLHREVFGVGPVTETDPGRSVEARVDLRGAEEGQEDGDGAVTKQAPFVCEHAEFLAKSPVLQAEPKQNPPAHPLVPTELAERRPKQPKPPTASNHRKLQQPKQPPLRKRRVNYIYGHLIPYQFYLFYSLWGFGVLGSNT